MTKSKETIPLENTIRAWENSLFHDRFLMNPSTIVIVESTIHYLKELQPRVKGSENNLENSL